MQLINLAAVYLKSKNLVLTLIIENQANLLGKEEKDDSMQHVFFFNYIVLRSIFMESKKSPSF